MFLPSSVCEFMLKSHLVPLVPSHLYAFKEGPAAIPQPRFLEVRDIRHGSTLLAYEVLDWESIKLIVIRIDDGGRAVITVCVAVASSIL